METKTCRACGETFIGRRQTPNQNYCARPQCQRERRRIWQQQKRREDSDYRENDARASKAWTTENRDYWKQYREQNPDYAERNRNLQQERNQKLRTSVIANEDVSLRPRQLLSGRYQMVRLSPDGEPTKDMWIVEISVLLATQVDEDA